MIADFTSSKPPRVLAGSPEWRAALFGQAIAFAGHLTGEICPLALGRHLWSFLGQSEEDCGSECLDAVVMLVQSGLFTINTVDAETGDLWIGGESKLTVRPMLTRYLYGEPEDLEGEA